MISQQATGASRPAERRPRKRVQRSAHQEAVRSRLIGMTAVFVFLLMWEGVVRLGVVNPMFTSSPSLIVEKFFSVLHDGSLGTDLRVSGSEFFIGYGLAVVIGIPLGIAIGWYRGVAAALDPYISALYATPKIALLPVIIIWLGIGIWSKVAIVFLGAIFQITVNTIAGVRSTDQNLVNAGRSFGAKDRQIFTTIALPGSIPFLIAGLRLAVGQGLVGIVVGEMYAATAGIGYEITVAGETFQTDRAFVFIVILATCGVIFVRLLAALEHKFDAWRPERSV